MMRVGLTCHSSFGGSGVIATELGLALAARGHEVHFICAHAPPRLVQAANVTLHEVESPTHPLFPHGEFTLALASKLAEVSRARRLELLHVHYAIPLAISAVLARELVGEGAPRLVTTVHGTDVHGIGQHAAFKPLVRQAMLRSAVVTAPSRFLAELAERAFELGDRRLEVVPNFIDTERFRPRSVRAESRTRGVAEVTGEPIPWPAGDARPLSPTLSPLAQGEGGAVLTHNSNFRSIKRMQDVVRIFERVRAEAPCRLVLLGDGPERPAVERFIAERGLSSHVQLLGEVRDVVPVLQQSAVFLLPSELESFGLAAVEAMSCGVPVVASAAGGLPEVIEDGQTGFLHPVGDVEGMAHSALRLLTDEALHARMSQAARAACVARWQVAPISDAWEALYARVLRNERT